MKKTAIAFFSFFIYGILGAVAYAFMLVNGFEQETGFVKVGRPLYLTIGVSAVFVLLAAAYCLTYKKGTVGKLSDLLLADGRLHLLIKIIIGFCMIYGAFLSIVAVNTGAGVLSFVNCLGILLSAVAILIIAFAQRRGAFDEIHYYMSMIPVVWSCVIFMEIFKKNGGNPILFSYLYQLLAGLFIMLSAYRFAALFFRKRGVRGFIVLTLLAYYFSMAFYGGQLVSLFFGASLDAGQISLILSSVGISLFLMLNASLIAPKAQAEYK